MSGYLLLKDDVDDEEDRPWLTDYAIDKYDDDPFREVRRVYKTYSEHIKRVKGSQLAASTFPFTNAFFALWNAIDETIKIVGEEEK